MHALSLALVIILGASEVRDGTVVVLENSNLLVEKYTRSEVTHVGMVLHRNNVPYVYEATPSEVRRVTLDTYYDELGNYNRSRSEKSKLRVRLYQPSKPYSASEVAELKGFFESQIGRRYSLKGYVRHKPAEGIHCAELVSTALTRTGRYKFSEAYSVSPAKLVEAIKPSHMEPIAVTVTPPELSGSWCERSRKWWGGMFAWCGWLCLEAWTICR